MLNRFTPVIAGFAILTGSIAAGSAAETAASLEPLQGKWTGTRPGRSGGERTVTLEFKQDQFSLLSINEASEVRMAAKARVKVQKAGPFLLMLLDGLQGGRTAEEMQPVDDDRAFVYTLRDNQLFLANNFDKERSDEKPVVEVFTRVQEKRAASRDGAKLAGEWKMEVVYVGQNLEYGLNIVQVEGKLTATLVSPRTGSYKFRTVEFKDGNLAMEVDRQIDGNDVTFVYKGKMVEGDLSGTMAVKGMEDQFSGTWKARK